MVIPRERQNTVSTSHMQEKAAMRILQRFSVIRMLKNEGTANSSTSRNVPEEYPYFTVFGQHEGKWQVSGGSEKNPAGITHHCYSYYGDGR